MRFGDLINEASIDLNLPSQPKEDVLRLLVSRLAHAHQGIDPEQAVSAVLEREFALSTGVGQGVAVPHATLPELKEPVVGFGRCPKGVDFAAMDNKPVNLLFLLLAPENEISLHLKLLSRISRLCTRQDLREALLTVSTPEEVLDLIKEHESDYQEL